MDQPSAKPRDNPWLDLVRLPSARRIVIMLFTSLALFIAFDRLLLQVMKRTPASNLAGRVLRDQELLLERPDARRLLALGDSRIKWMANPKLLSPGLGLPEGSGLNISLPATYVADDLAVLHWLESSGVLDDTKVLLWGMGFDRFHPDVHSPLNVHAFFDPWARGHRFNGISDAMFAAAAPSVLARANLQAMLQEKGVRRTLRDALDYDPQTDRQALGFVVNTAKPNPNVGIGPFFNLPRVDGELARRTIDRAVRIKARGVRVIVVDTPVAPVLYRFYVEKRADAWAAYLRFLEDLEKAGVEVLRDNPTSLPPEVFTDAVHLTADAAESYLKDLIRRLNGPRQASVQGP